MECSSAYRIKWFSYASSGLWSSLWQLAPNLLQFHRIITLSMAIIYYGITFSNGFLQQLNPDSSAWPQGPPGPSFLICSHFGPGALWQSRSYLAVLAT